MSSEKIKHLIFDLDGTICESRQDISLEMKDLLSKSSLSYDIVVISGAERNRIEKQLKGLKCFIMAQSGNETAFWKRTLTDNEKKKILQHINKLPSLVPDFLKTEDRGCQISYSFIGHNADVEDKKLFDPTGEKREAILKETPFISETLECRIAGTTCFDYTRKDGTKGKNIERLLKHLKWDKEDCVYFGDKLQKGGNDESVIGVINTIEVADPADLMVKLKQQYV